MIRKWMSLFLAVMMAFAMPMSAFADVQHTLAVKPGELLQSEEAIADLLEVLKLRLTLGEESGALTVLLDDSNVVTLGLTADATGLYAGSNLFGADILYITWDDIFALIGDVLIESMAEAGAEEEVLQQLRAGFEEAKKEIIAAAGGMMSAPQTEATASLEESLKAAEELFPDDPAMVAFIMKLYEDMVIETGSFADEARDTADQKHRLTMDEENLLALCETAYMKNAITKALAAEMPEASEAELSAAAVETLLEVKMLYEESNFEMIMEIYTADAGQTLVGMDMTMNMDLNATEIEGEPLEMHTLMTAAYDRLTSENGVSHKADAALTIDSSVLEVSFDLLQSNDGASNGMLGMLADGEEIVVQYQTEKPAEDTCVRSADIYFLSGASAILKPAASDRPAIGFEIVTEPAPLETLAALENADASTSVELLKRSETQMQELLDQISLNATQALYTALDQMPTSTLNLLISSGVMGE